MLTDMKRLLYVSECTMEQSVASASVREFVAGAQVRNAKLNLTGALLFTEKYFAQILEGPIRSVDVLMASINVDPRHGCIVVVDESPITERKFAEWKMAYHGPSEFVSRHVSRLLHRTSKSEQLRATEWLTELAYEFSNPQLN